MTALRLFESAELPAPVAPEPETTLRAYCPRCQEFTVHPASGRCLCCSRPKADRYDYVEMGDDDEL